VAVWSLTGPAFAGALADPIEAWLRCGPIGARDTIVHGRPVVRDGALVNTHVEQRVREHRIVAARMQA
jgi:hypothetical protein